MGYYERQDIPFQWALADAFTILDNNFCSVLGPTHPNHYMWMSGTIARTASPARPWTTAGRTATTPGTPTRHASAITVRVPQPSAEFRQIGT